MKVLVLIDEPIEYDQRVQSILIHYPNALVFNYKKLSVKSINLSLLFIISLPLLLESLIYAPICWIKIFKKYKYYPRGFFTGVLKTFKLNYRIQQTVLYMKKNYQDINLIYCNDLTCGLLGMKLANEFQCEYIYDAHEISLHRNRVNSFIRVACDYIIEKKIVKNCKKLVLVNQPTINVYTNMYNIPKSKVTIINNNHFAPYFKYAFSRFRSTITNAAIVYIGGGTNGRKLESLAEDAKKTKIDIYGFFMTENPKIAYQYNWILGSKDYLDDFLKLITEKRLVMWCCTEDLCLSYRLSLPNKFFQAMAVGIPVIAYKDSYLADIVTQYNLGYIYDDKNFIHIINEMEDTERYYALLKSIAKFQDKLFIEKLVL